MEKFIVDMFYTFIDKDSYPFNNDDLSFKWHVKHYNINTSELYEKLIILHIINVLNEEYKYLTYSEDNKNKDVIVYLMVDNANKQSLLNVINYFSNSKEIFNIKMEILNVLHENNIFYNLKINYKINELIEYMNNIEKNKQLVLKK